MADPAIVTWFALRNLRRTYWESNP